MSARQLNAHVRAHQCSICPTPCTLQTDATAHLDGCAACPLSTWGPWDCRPVAGSVSDPAPETIRGFGDLVHAVALPIAKALGLPCVDPATQKLRPESPCAQRQNRWNKAMPIGRRP